MKTTDYCEKCKRYTLGYLTTGGFRCQTCNHSTSPSLMKITDYCESCKSYSVGHLTTGGFQCSCNHISPIAPLFKKA